MAGLERLTLEGGRPRDEAMLGILDIVIQLHQFRNLDL